MTQSLKPAVLISVIITGVSVCVERGVKGQRLKVSGGSHLEVLMTGPHFRPFGSTALQSMAIQGPGHSDSVTDTFHCLLLFLDSLFEL